MLPVLWLVPRGDYGLLVGDVEVMWLLLGAGLFGAASGAIRFESYKYLPIGVVQTMNTALRVLLVVGLTAVFLGEFLKPMELLIGAGILISFGFLKVDVADFPHLDKRTWKGYLQVTVGGLFLASSLVCFGVASREISPFLAGYVWEVLIGIFSLAFLVVGRFAGFGEKLELIERKDVWPIVLISTLTIVGTSGMAGAVNYGPIALVQVVGATGMIFATLFAHFFYKEKLNLRQWAVVCVVLIGVMGLVLVGR